MLTFALILNKIWEQLFCLFGLIQHILECALAQSNLFVRNLFSYLIMKLLDLFTELNFFSNSLLRLVRQIVAKFLLKIR